jgi:uncharacterized membrane protein YhaH (DUF805 family)
MANFCENCGSPLKTDNKFCPNCGAPIKSADTAGSAEPAAPPSSSAGDASPIGPVAGAAAAATAESLRTEPASEKPQEAFVSPQQHMNSSQQNFHEEAGSEKESVLPPPDPENRQDVPPVNFNRPKDFAQGGTGPKYEPDNDFRSMFLRFDNRLNRKRYIKRSFALVGIATILLIITGIIATLTNVSPETAGMVVTFALLIPAYSLMIRRLHDLNRPAWWCILSIIQVVFHLFFKNPPFILTLIVGVLGLLNFVLGIYLLFFKGTDGPNQYGPDPLEGQN